MGCPECGTVVSVGATACQGCGARLGRICWNCERDLVPGAAFCHSCGSRVTESGNAAKDAGTRDHSPAPEAGSRPSIEKSDRRERRQVTILFCDLVGSTALSNSLDPEDLNEVFRVFRDKSSEVMRRHEGTISSFRGDGIDVLFGYPRAYEDDAERAVRAGLEIVSSMRGVYPLPNVDLEVRVGIATGVVVLGDLIGKDAPREKAAVGGTPHLAARLQELAKPGTVMISPATRRLISDLFDCLDLGPRNLKGFPEPVRVWQVVDEYAVDNRFEASHRGLELSPLKGRDRELSALLERWRLARNGGSQIVTLLGEPGVGKSRLCRVLCELTKSESRALLQYSCAPRFQNTALHPVIRQIERAARLSRTDSPGTMLEKLEALLGSTPLARRLPEIMPYFAALLSIPAEDRYAPITESAERQKERIVGELEAFLAGLASSAPVMILCEDLHWADPSTMQLISRMVETLAELPVLIVVTTRPGIKVPWSGHGRAYTLELPRLETTDAASIVSHLANGKSLPPPILDQILEKSDGIPLFIEELTKSVLESGHLEDRGDHFATAGSMPALAVPSTLQDSLMGRLDRLPTTREVVQIGAAIGREFSLDLLAAMLPMTGEALLAELQRLIDADLIHRQGTPPKVTFAFKHALIQDAAHATLLRGVRHDLHRKIAEVLEQRFPGTVQAQPELLAYHYREAALPWKAVEYLKVAGYQARTRSANQEARNHFRTALALLQSVPDSLERKQEQLELQTALGPVLAALEGYAAADVEETYARAEALHNEIKGSASEDYASNLRGKFQVALLQARYRARNPRDQGAEVLIEEFASLVAGNQYDAAYRADGELGRGLLALFMGRFPEAKQRLEKSFSSQDSEMLKDYALRYCLDPESARLAYRARTLWFMGFPDQALELGRQALQQAQVSAISLSIAQAMGILAMLHQVRGEVDSAHDLAEQAIQYADDNGLAYWVALSRIVKGWALAHKGLAIPGIDMIRGSLDAFRAQNAHLGCSSFLVFLAEAYQQAGRCEEGLDMADKAIAHIDETGERYYEAEVHRRKGELLLANFGPTRSSEAETCFRRSLGIAGEQHAWGWGLRAATSLARLLGEQRRRQEALDLLRTYRERVTGGNGTADLRGAEILIGEFAGSPIGIAGAFH
jgi:class 3 adenylate cyclase/predicted ATPase